MSTIKVNFKTLDQRNFSLILDERCRTVEDLICKIEDTLGRDNLYKLIFSGKLLKEEQLLKDYSLNSRIPIIVMATKSPNQENTNSKNKQDLLKEEEKLDLESADFKRVRTVTEDSGIEEDLDNDDHFVTEAEFESVLEIILACSYLSDKDDQALLSNKEIQEIVDQYCIEAEVGSDFKDIFDKNMNKIIDAKINKAQMMALVEDIHDLFEEPREKASSSSNEQNIAMLECDMEASDDEFEEEREELNLDMKVEKLVDMGFPVEAAREALERGSYNLTVAIELLMPTPKPSFANTSTLTKNNPLAFLRDIEEFQFLRFQVLQDPSILQPLLISFGQSHPDLMKRINKNKEIFISMLYEQTGAKLHGRH